MAKKVAEKPDSLKSDRVHDIYSVSSCISNDFADYINFWKHNGYWFFDSPEIIRDLAKENGIDLAGTKIFFYEVYEYQWYEDESEWENFGPEKSFETNVQLPKNKVPEGFDVVSFHNQTSPECSYLSCNHMAQGIRVNRHCLLESLEEAKRLLEQKAFAGCEPGPCRIFSVYSVLNP